MYPFFFDWTFLLLIPALMLAFYAQMRVRSAYERYSRMRAGSGMTGAQVARQLLDRNGLSNVVVEKTSGVLSDHYDPRKQVLRLSEAIYSSNSIAALGVAAHETGHALQHGTGYLPLMLRNNFVPVVNLGTSLAFPLFFIGFLFRGPILMDIGIILFSLAVVFHLITLPVEFDASRRALGLLAREGYLRRDEVGSARAVLNAAAWTYVAAAAVAAVQLVRLLLLRGQRD
ncbi:MAG TPA: zinc metallopeptidase [Candidatus Latescibacteria bacterium]|nr:zinc metallopeptidase [Candidatus Latescibacterota bacterium]